MRVYMYTSIPPCKAGEGKWVGASILLCLCSSLSKEQGVTVLAVCLVYDYLVLQKVGRNAAVIIYLPSEPTMWCWNVRSWTLS